MAETRKGFHTSEFIVTTAASVAAILAAVSGILDGQVAAVVVAISEGLYAISRGLAKK